MDHRERRVAQIVRDFLEAYQLSAEIHEALAQGGLDFARVARLVGDSEESALYRLKEECHALFRLDGERSSLELDADELFDLEVAALFHEGMKFRESYYLTTTYGPRLERMMAEGSATGPLAGAFLRLFEAGRRRMLESGSEVASLFRETRDQLLTVLHQMPPSGLIARSLVEDPERSEAVFGVPLPALLEDVYGSPREGFKLAVESLIQNGHFSEATALLVGPEFEGDGYGERTQAFSEGMARYYSGDVQAALGMLSDWVAQGAEGLPEWRAQARRVLEAVAGDAESPDPSLGERARVLAEQITL